MLVQLIKYKVVEYHVYGDQIQTIKKFKEYVYVYVYAMSMSMSIMSMVKFRLSCLCLWSCLL